MTYDDYTDGVTATIDGAGPETQSIGADVENLTGGTGDDVLNGDGGPNA